MSTRTKRDGADFAGGERRQLTVMFCDIVDSTGMSERLDPEDLRAILQAFQNVCISALERFGGAVANYSGDGILAQFGWPVAIEKAPVAAVRAALAIIADMQPLQQQTKRQYGESLHLRIGIQTGMVVVGDMGSDRFRQSGALVGEALNVAARLQTIAGPDAIVIGSATEALLENRFELQPLGPQSLKGLTRGVLAYEVKSERYFEDPFAAVPRHQASRFVDRDEELARLVELWRTATGGSGQSVVVVGDAGIGKSRLVHELRASIRGEPFREVGIYGSVHHKNVALHPFIDYVRHAAGSNVPQAAAENLHRLVGALGAPPPDEAVVRHLEQLAFGVAATSAGQPVKIAPVSPDTRRKLHGLLRELVLQRADPLPLLLVVEDAQWFDPSSVELVDRLLGAVPGRRALMLITSREELRAGPGGAPRPLHRMALRRLGETACRSIVQSVVGERPIPEPVLASIAARWDGSPLFAEELALAYVATGAFTPARSAGQDDQIGPVDAMVPAALHDSLLVRLDQLSDAKHVAQIASVLGRTFPHNLLAAMHGPEAARLDTGLWQLLEAGIFEHADGEAQAWYRFKHALLRDAAYQSLLRRQRQALHAKAAKAIQESIAEIEEQKPDLLAQHWANAGEPLLAAQWGLKAARISAARSSDQEAMAQVAGVFEQLALLPEGEGRDTIELEACVAMVGPLIATKGYGAPDVAAIAARALDLCRRRPPGPDVDARIFPILYCQWSHQQVTGLVREAHELARQLVAQAESQSSSGPKVIARRLLGTSTLLAGDPASARTSLEGSLALYNAAEHAGLAYVYGTDFGIMSKCHLALALWILGSTGRASDLSEEAQREAIAFGHANTFGYALTHLCLLKALQRDDAGMAALAGRIMAFSKEHELPFWTVIAQLFLGRNEVNAGDPQRGLAMIRGCLEFMRKLNLVYGMPIYLTWLGEACARTGDSEGAERNVDEALAIADRGGERWFEPESWRFKASLAIAGGHGAPAAVLALRRSLELAAARGERSFELRSALDLARLLVADREAQWDEPAAQLLARALTPFANEPETPDQSEARALLQAIGGSSSRTAA
jgi:class 3 adenylate cyclase/ABC-type transport system involved in cytochrome c biogenesis ATPase subunit